MATTGKTMTEAASAEKNKGKHAWKEEQHYEIRRLKKEEGLTVEMITAPCKGKKAKPSKDKLHDLGTNPILKPAYDRYMQNKDGLKNFREQIICDLEDEEEDGDDDDMTTKRTTATSINSDGSINDGTFFGAPLLDGSGNKIIWTTTSYFTKSNLPDELKNGPWFTVKNDQIIRGSTKWNQAGVSFDELASNQKVTVLRWYNNIFELKATLESKAERNKNTATLPTASSTKPPPINVLPPPSPPKAPANDKAPINDDEAPATAMPKVPGTPMAKAEVVSTVPTVETALQILANGQVENRQNIQTAVALSVQNQHTLLAQGKDIQKTLDVALAADQRSKKAEAKADEANITAASAKKIAKKTARSAKKFGKRIVSGINRVLSPGKKIDVSFTFDDASSNPSSSSPGSMSSSSTSPTLPSSRRIRFNTPTKPASSPPNLKSVSEQQEIEQKMAAADDTPMPMSAAAAAGGVIVPQAPSESSVLPAESMKSKQKRWVHVDPETHEPTGWKSAVNQKTGQIYYVHKETDVVQYKSPFDGMYHYDEGHQGSKLKTPSGQKTGTSTKENDDPKGNLKTALEENPKTDNEKGWLVGAWWGSNSENDK